MNILLFLFPIALLLSIVGLLLFFWTIKNNQYEDLEGAANRILFEENDINDSS